MEYFSNLNRPPRVRENFTNRKQPVYKAVSDKVTGQRKLIKDKEIDVYDKIQEYSEETKITTLLQKYNLDMLKQLGDHEEQLVDLTNLPTNLMETMQIIDDAKYAWDRQSKEIKAKFNNDFHQFIASSETGELAKLLNDELKVSSERFQTSNMANFDASKTNLQSYQPISQQTVAQPTIEQQTINQTQATLQQGVNLNV